MEVNAILSDYANLLKPKTYKKVSAVEKPKRKYVSSSIVERLILEINFQDFKDIYNTKVFQDNFQRPSLGDPKLSTYVTLDDVKDVVLYTAVYDIPKDFVKFFLSDQVDRLLRSTLLYMQYFLEIFRTVQKRREAVNKNKLRHPISSYFETIWKESLSNLRFVVARDYCVILMGLGGTESFHHFRSSKRGLSMQSRDLMLHQLLLLFMIRVVEVVLLEKENPVVAEEVTRLFSVGGLKVDRKKKYGMKQMDVDILEHHFTIPTMTSKSVISKEFARSNRNVYLKSIGQQPWLPRDAPTYFLSIEFVLVASESRYGDANVVLGILGTERQHFDCFLNLEHRYIQRGRGESKSETPGEDEMEIWTPFHLKEKTVQMSGPPTLLPKRDSLAQFHFDESFFERCENYNEAHMKIRKPRWIAFRKMNSRMNYDPEECQLEKHLQFVKDSLPRATSSHQTHRRSKTKSSSFIKTLDQNRVLNRWKTPFPSFFFQPPTIKSDSEDDIVAGFHEAFNNEQKIQNMTPQN